VKGYMKYSMMILIFYRCSGEEGQYTYEQVTSILQGGLDVDRVPSPLADAMVTRALDYVSA
jgi:hypothetical protein